MYPYPSGAAHMGHVRNYTFGDLLVRYRTMNGQAVLSPIGFDSFGLPAENAAIKTGEHPRPFTEARIEELTSSLLRLGASYDWRRVVKSHDPVLHPLDPVDLPAAPGGRPGLPGRGPGELVPRLPDRAGQRAGPGRRHLRALRRPGPAQEPGAVVLQDHRLRPAAAGRHRRSGLARAGQDHAAQLDRSLRGGHLPLARRRAGGPEPGGLHHPARHQLRHDLRRGRARAPHRGRADHRRPAGRGRGLRGPCDRRERAGAAELGGPVGQARACSPAPTS